MDKISLHSPGHSCLRRGRILGGGSVGRTTLSLLPRCNWPNHLICRHICSLYKHWGTQRGGGKGKIGEEVEEECLWGKKAKEDSPIKINLHLEAFGIWRGAEHRWGKKLGKMLPIDTELHKPAHQSTWRSCCIWICLKRGWHRGVSLLKFSV